VICVGYADACLCGSRPAGGLLSCRDKKVTKETPSRSLRRPAAGSLRSSLKPGAAQLASRFQRDWLEQVLAHTPGLSSGAQLAPTEVCQRQRPLLAPAGAARLAAANGAQYQDRDLPLVVSAINQQGKTGHIVFAEVIDAPRKAMARGSALELRSKSYACATRAIASVVGSYVMLTHE